MEAFQWLLTIVIGIAQELHYFQNFIILKTIIIIN